MGVHFTMEELATIALYRPERGRLATIRTMTESMSHTDDPTVLGLLRGALAKLNLCSDQDFGRCDFNAAAAMFE